ncbi:hypothetical protein D3C87_1908700 [compost metagenome]
MNGKNRFNGNANLYQRVDKLLVSFLGLTLEQRQPFFHLRQRIAAKDCAATLGVVLVGGRDNAFKLFANRLESHGIL